MIAEFILRVVDSEGDRDEEYRNDLHEHRNTPSRCSKEFETENDDSKDDPRERCFPKSDHQTKENKKYCPEHPDIS